MMDPRIGLDWLREGSVGQEYRGAADTPGFDLPLTDAEFSNPTVAQKKALAAQWDAQDPGWFTLNYHYSSGADFAYEPEVRCPSGTPAAGAWITTRVTEADYIFSINDYNTTRRIWLVWAVDQVLLHGCSGQPTQVNTPCPPGQVRTRNASGQEICFGCSPPLEIAYDASGRAFCRSRPRLREAPRSRPALRESLQTRINRRFQVVDESTLCPTNYFWNNTTRRCEPMG